MRTKLLALLLLGAASVFGGVSIGIRIGHPPPVRVVRVRPSSPGPDFVWVGGYWYPSGRHYRWHDGYWTRPAYSGARWVEPRHDGQLYYNGYWDGDSGRREHEHQWDRDHDRDFHDHH